MKADEISALHQFSMEINRINSEDPGGAYLKELVDHQYHIARNLKSDFPWATGIYVTQQYHEAHMQDAGAKVAPAVNALKRLTAELDELKEWDIRKLAKQEKELEARIRMNDQTNISLQGQLDELRVKMDRRGNDDG